MTNMRICLWYDNGWFYDDAEEHGFGPNAPVGPFESEEMAKEDCLKTFNIKGPVEWEDGEPIHYHDYIEK